MCVQGDVCENVRMFMIITHEPQYIIRTDTKENKEVFGIEKEIAYSGRR